MKHIAAFLGVSIILLTAGCEKSPELATDIIPVFSGIVETNVSYKKVSFSASFENSIPQNVEDCGFEWSEKSDNIINRVSIGTISTPEFSVQLVAKLKEGVEYKVRSWIKTGSLKFYSEPTYFSGTVAFKPEIISLNRSYALWGDTLRIKVRNLSPDILPEDVIVTIENVYIHPLSIDTNGLAVIMPFSETRSNLTVGIRVNNQSGTNTREIENALPEITSISPQWLHFEDPISIKGKFRSEYSKRIILVESYYASQFELLSYTDGEIVVKGNERFVCLPSYFITFKIFREAGSNEYTYLYTGYSVNRPGNCK
jgi:hypothetical protein